MKKLILLNFALFISVFSCKNDTKDYKLIANNTTATENIETKLSSIQIFPINHATMVLKYVEGENNTIIYVDPVGGADVFKDFEAPTLVIITDIHGDHLNSETLKAMDLTNTTLVVPQAVNDKITDLTTNATIVVNNGDTITFNSIKIEAIPMYNLRKEALKFHEKGRGNGYVLTLGNERIYISGDTEDIPEMRALKNIDKAFVCMNLPYTMTVESAASAVLEFQPKQVFPYHYRGTEGLSDINKFNTIVSESNPNIKIVQLDWYKQ
jgi:L-ascorbate metabolism protein UlaG (beta-lactamase superfamily)